MTPFGRPRARQTFAADGGEALADALEVAAAALRAGLAPSAALALMAEATAWGRREADRVEAVRRLMALGRPTKEAWCRSADSRDEAHAYHSVAGVWDLALQTGGPLADAVDDVAGHLREEARLRGRLEALAAGPRTSRRLLTVLPLAGPVLAVLIGADLRQLYGSIAGAASVATGIALTAVGWWWSRTMVDAATRPRPYPVSTDP